ncbi:MAG: hypothetical protein P4N59_01415 [Negativicutes bacterium]|nr:hypothetical protein [Negativicutes bacterium]
MGDQLYRIYELKLQLLRMGYHGFQVDAMCREVIGKALPEEVAAEHRQQLISALEAYTEFAMKCQRGYETRK